MEKKIKILVVTNLPWREDNSIGNSYSNIFRGTSDKYEFAQIYIRDGMPQNDIVHDYYHISEKKMMKHIFKRKTVVGRSFHLENSLDMKKDSFGSLYNKARILRWPVFFLVRDFIGISNCWKTPDFERFLDEFQPDVVFGTLSTIASINRIMWYVSESRHIPLITYPWDDYYSLRHYTLSPIFWIRKLLNRHYLRKTALKSDFMYCISDIMIKEYSKEFRKECKLLFKCNEFVEKRVVFKEIKSPVNFVFMGNIGQGRWKSLARLAQAIKSVNEKMGKQVSVLNVYTLSPRNTEIQDALNVEGASILNEAVPNNLVFSTMESADILIHAEPLEREEIQFFRASFSTKIVDYFYNAKCIFAIGGMTASTEYLKRNDAAIIETDIDKIEMTVLKIVNNPNLIQEYAQKSWDCGVRNHQKKVIQDRMYNDFRSVINNYKNK